MFIKGKYYPGIPVNGTEYERVIKYFTKMTRKNPDGPITYWKRFRYNRRWYLVTFEYNVYNVTATTYKRWSEFRWNEEQCGMSKD